MNKVRLSAVVLTKNEEKNIESCIKSLKFCDEIIIVDDNSIDKTRVIAESMDSKVYIRRMNKNYAEQSNFGMDKAKGEWVFFIDADERISDKLSTEIQNTIEVYGNNLSGFRFKRIDYMWGKWLKHGEIGSFRSVRLFRKGKGKWERRVHPHLNIEGEIRELINPIKHYPHQSLRKFVESVDRWSSWHAIANEEEGKRSNIAKIIFWPIAHFIRNYIFRLGLLDGMQGFVFAVIMSFHSYLSWSKLWLNQKNIS